LSAQDADPLEVYLFAAVQFTEALPQRDVNAAADDKATDAGDQDQIDPVGEVGILGRARLGIEKVYPCEDRPARRAAVRTVTLAAGFTDRRRSRPTSKHASRRNLA
jgi:hypothetical protein